MNSSFGITAILKTIHSYAGTLTMITNTESYIQIIEYLVENLNLFEDSCSVDKKAATVMAVIEKELSDQIISVCNQNDNLTHTQRNTIIREVDAIAYDLEEVLSGVVNNPATDPQKEFIKEFSILIKNIFDNEIKTITDG